MHSSAIARARREISRRKFKVMGDHDAFLSRIKKSLYYGKLPLTERFSLPVTEIAAELFSEIKNGKSLDRLDIENAAELSRNACASPCSLVLALLYLERLKTRNPDYLQRVGPSELFLVSMLIASKFLHDDGEEDEVFNDEWASSAGLDVKEINQFEKDFLSAINWEVFVNERTFWSRLSGLEKDVALKEGKRRGWFSYSDLDHLLDNVDLSSLAQTIFSVSAVCLASYAASVLTLLGSAFIVSNIPGNSLSASRSALRGNEGTPLDLSDASTSTSSSASLDDAASKLALSSISPCSVPDSIECENRLLIDEDLELRNHNKSDDEGNVQCNWLQNSHCTILATPNSTNGNTDVEVNPDKAVWLSDSKYIEEKNKSSNSSGLLEWLILARTWLTDSHTECYQPRYSPLEIAASC